MLPFATYKIPESTKHKTPDTGKWLSIVTKGMLSVEDEDLLRKICAALKADFETNVLLISIPENDDTAPLQIQHTSTKLILSFGVHPSSLGIWIDIPSTGIRFMESFTFILTAPLHELSKSPNAKKQLWSFMQSFLELK